MTPVERLVVLGQGYVGLNVAVRAVEQGFDVVGYDTDTSKVERLAAAESPVDTVATARLKDALATQRYAPTADSAALADFDFAVISVPTPLKDGNPDLSHIESAARTLAPHTRRGSCVVLESTTYPGTTTELVAPILDTGSGLTAGVDFALGYSPERINPGDPFTSLETTPKVVSGVNDASLATVEAFYGRLVDETVAVSGTKEAELTKLLENTFRHVNVALINELAMFAHDLDIDVWEAIDAASTKPFGYLRFTPGPGVGGHCLPIDPSYLSWRVRDSLGESFRFVELANEVNDHMPDYVVRRLQSTLNDQGRPLRGQKILLLGLAYKPNTRDARESPGLAIAERLTDQGAVVVAADPHVADDLALGSIRRVDATGEEIGDADAVVVVVDHDAFDMDLVVRHARYVLDTRHCLDGPQVEHL